MGEPTHICHRCGERITYGAHAHGCSHALQIAIAALREIVDVEFETDDVDVALGRYGAGREIAETALAKLVEIGAVS